MNKHKFVMAAFFTLLVFASISFAQTEKQITAIRADVQLINKGAPKYSKAVKNLGSLSAEGDETTYFSSGTELKKILSKIYGETGRSTMEFYYSGDNVIFAYERSERYDQAIGTGKTPKVVRVVETRAYFKDGKCIRLLSGKRSLAAGSVEFEDALKRLLDTSDQMRAEKDK